MDRCNRCEGEAVTGPHGTNWDGCIKALVMRMEILEDQNEALLAEIDGLQRQLTKLDDAVDPRSAV